LILHSCFKGQKQKSRVYLVLGMSMRQFCNLRMLVRKNYCSDWWPEAESNCRPLVFQIWANHLTLVYFTLTYFKYRYLLEALFKQLEYLQTTVVK